MVTTNIKRKFLRSSVNLAILGAFFVSAFLSPDVYGSTAKSANAQASEQKVSPLIVVPAAVVNIAVGGAQGAPYDLLVLVDGWLCGGVRLSGPGAVPRAPDEDVVIAFDFARVPAECARKGGEIAFAINSGHILAFRAPSLGETVRLESFELEPPSGNTLLVIPRFVRHAAEGDVKFFEVYANDGVHCGSVSIDTVQLNDGLDDLSLSLDAPETPPICSTAGVSLTVVTTYLYPEGYQSRLVAHPIVAADGRTMLLGIGPEPPGSGGGESEDIAKTPDVDFPPAVLSAVIIGMLLFAFVIGRARLTSHLVAR